MLCGGFSFDTRRSWLTLRRLRCSQARQVAKAVAQNSERLIAEREEFEGALRQALSFAVAKGRAVALAEMIRKDDGGDIPFDATELAGMGQGEYEAKRFAFQQARPSAFTCQRDFREVSCA